MENTESEKFITLYNKLDAYMRKKLGSDKHIYHTALLREMALKNKVFADNFQDLKIFSEVRNMLIHNPYKQFANPLFYPHSYITKKYEEIINLIFNPPLALSIAVPANVIYKATPDTLIQKLMKTMIDKNYTHVPIIKDGSMIGVFSENTLLSFLVTNHEGIILKDAKVSDFAEFIPFDKHMNEYFEFIPRKKLLTDVEKIFRQGMKDGKRIAVVYITENGKSDEKVLGMITPWDLTSE